MSCDCYELSEDEFTRRLRTGGETFAPMNGISDDGEESEAPRD